MQIGKREQANGTIVTGPWLDRPAPRRPSPVATKAKGAQPQQPVLALAGPPTVTLTHLKPDATGTLAPRASAARPERARDRSKTTICRDFQDSRLGSRLVTGRTSRVDVPATPSRTKQCYSRNAQQFRNRHRSKTRCFVHQQGQSCCTRKLGLRKPARGRPTHQLSKHTRFCRRMTLAAYTEMDPGNWTVR